MRQQIDITENTSVYILSPQQNFKKYYDIKYSGYQISSHLVQLQLSRT